MQNKQNLGKISSRSKIAKISEIIELLEEQNKGKDWLLEEIKKHDNQINISPTSNRFEILKICKYNFLINLLHKLKSDEFKIHDVNTLSKTFHWFFVDIVMASDPNISTKSQIRKIMALTSHIKNTNTFKLKDPHSTVLVPTGDGVVIGFSDSSEKPFRLAIELHKILFKYNKSKPKKDKIHIRIGLDTGPVYFIPDLDENNTVWGPGIITARRVMDLCEENHIFASTRIGEDVQKLSPEYKDIMHQIGVYSVKHGQEISIYNIYGKDFGNKKTPTLNKIPELQNPLKYIPDFEFNKIEIKLDITDLNTMMCHHTWIWDIKSLTKDPLEQIFYDLIGDTPREFSDLNVTVKDEKKRKLEILSIDKNTDYEKRFNIKMTRPIKKNQKNRKITLEYDWQEPNRIFEYTVSAKCKKLMYHLTIPKGVSIKNRVFEVIRDLGIKTRADPPAKIKYLKDKTEITWETENRITEKHDSFEFQW